MSLLPKGKKGEMTKLLDRAISEIRRLPNNRQDEAAEILLAIASQESDDFRLSPEQMVDLEERLAGPPDYATEAEAAAVIRRLTR